MTPDKKYLNHLCNLLSEEYTPVMVQSLPKGLTLFSTDQIIDKFESFMPEGVLTKESIYETLTEIGYELAEIKPLSFVWVMQPKRQKK